jgi:chromosome segregation protein
MRLDKVEIVGFKSFCDKQELDFKGGVTGIVGPNGCGKSNISDAISWVLGEQSAKSLRGASMEDVIFNGSQARQPLHMAEVNLKVSGLNGNSPDGAPDCVITRRLYRNGESEYLMNGHLCRLRDIHELFMDTGLGSKAYSIIEQGKIGLILSSKPADRRALIEEAAGITKYKARRRQTALKLDAAQQNLLRVNDIVHEVEKQLESLKRQAGKARRYRALRDQMHGLERVLYGRRFLELRDQAGSLEERIAVDAEREQIAALSLETEEAQMQARRTSLYEDEGRLEEVRQRLSELTLGVDRHQARSGYCKDQLADTAARAAAARQEADELESRAPVLAATLADRRAERDRGLAELSEAERDAAGSDDALHAAATEQARLEAEQESARDAQLDNLSGLATLQNARESVTGSGERAAGELLQLASELEELERERARTIGERDLARERGERASALLEGLVRDRDVAQTQAGDARQKALELARQAEALQSESNSLQGRLASLEEIVATHAAFDEGVRALLDPGAPFDPERANVAVLGVVADALETDSAHERSVEAFLGDRLQAVIVPDAATALDGIRWLEAGGAGRATFLPLGAHGGGRAYELREAAQREPRARGLVSDLFRLTGPHAEEVGAALPDGLVFETLEDALEARPRHPDVPLVTLGGEVLRGGLLEGGRAVKGLLAPRREIREIGQRREELEAQLSGLREAEQAEAASEEAAASLARMLEERMHEADKDLVAIRHVLAAATEEHARLERKAVVIATERSQAEQEREAATVRLREIEEALLRAEAGRASASERLASLASALVQARAACETAQARSTETRSRLAALRERAAAVETECRRLDEDEDELRGRIDAAHSRIAELARRREELTTELAEAERLVGETLSLRDTVTGEVAVAEDRVREVRNEIESREQALKERRRERETLRDALAELQVAKARNDSDLDHLARECQQTLGHGAAEAALALGDEDKAREMAELLTQVQELRERIDRMGPVNVLAVEQAQELEERHHFLTAQRQDLLDSIAEMDQAIKKIDRTSRERFREAFQVINEHFGQVFKQLFGGGTAGLSLIDEEDILESGIDVMAQPPGKRLQNVMLLSGGEKALTAISLLFAIFQYKPSPFCILDEVDAPLDDANIGRFVRMLEGLKDQTQFVLITHSRRTMEIADQLYGVTMEEPGVSKLVSVRFS